MEPIAVRAHGSPADPLDHMTPMRFMAIIGLLASLFGAGCKQKDHLTEFSTNFDSDMVRPFLERIQPFIESGFGPAQIQQVCDVVATLKHDEERDLEFSIRHAGKTGTLRIHIFMDDIASPDIYFFSPPDVTQKIEAEFQRFANERGI